MGLGHDGTGAELYVAHNQAGRRHDAPRVEAILAEESGHKLDFPLDVFPEL